MSSVASLLENLVMEVNPIHSTSSVACGLAVFHFTEMILITVYIGSTQSSGIFLPICQRKRTDQLS